MASATPSEDDPPRMFALLRDANSALRSIRDRSAPCHPATTMASPKIQHDRESHTHRMTGRPALSSLEASSYLCRRQAGLARRRRPAVVVRGGLFNSGSGQHETHRDASAAAAAVVRGPVAGKSAQRRADVRRQRRLRRPGMLRQSPGQDAAHRPARRAKCEVHGVLHRLAVLHALARGAADRSAPGPQWTERADLQDRRVGADLPAAA